MAAIGVHLGCTSACVAVYKVRGWESWAMDFMSATPFSALSCIQVKDAVLSAEKRRMEAKGRAGPSSYPAAYLASPLRPG